MESFIKESKEIICKASKNNKLVIFVGAGVSMNSGYPSWRSIIEEFAKGLGIKIDDYSSDDYLKIPQYYYNLRKEKEYYDVILNKFNITGEPNLIHELILDLEPVQIITTNYDDLIERIANMKGMFFDVVAKDSDLPYSVNNKMIIKMHGDLKNKNIVLKEDDYLSYFNNFQLIHNYIKSLISTHIVLFVGYSISDINVKYIFQWVKDILKKDFQQAYFIESDSEKEFNQLEFEYYKNRGINILYTSSCNEIDYFKKEFNYENLNDNKAKSMVKFLSYLVEDDVNKKITVDIAYERLRILDALNLIGIEDIMTTLSLVVPWNEGGKIYYSHYELKAGQLTIYTNKLKSLFDDLNNASQSEKVNVVNKIFYNAGVRRVVDIEKNILMEMNSIDLININEEIYLFNYESLNKAIKFNRLDSINGREKDVLDYTYKLYKLGRYYEAYLMLKKVSESCIENKKYYLYFISEFNRYYLGKNIADINIFNIFRLGISLEEQERIRSEIRKINLDNIYLKLPRGYIKNIDVYKDILTFRFIYRKLKEVIAYEKKIEEEQNTIFSGVGEKDGTIYELKDTMQCFCDFITSNRLFIDNYTELKTSFYKFIDSILFSYSLKDKKVDKSFWGLPGKRVKLTEIDYFTIYSIVNYLEYEDVRNLFEKYKIDELVVEKDVLKKLEDVNYNLVYALNNINSFNNINNKYSNFLFIISRINIGEKNVENTIEYFLDMLENNKKKVDKKVVNSISSFIAKQNKLYQFNISIDIIYKLIKKCFIVIRDEDNGHEEVRKSIQLLIYNIINIVINNNMKINLSDEQVIVNYIKDEKDTLEYYKMLINLYKIMSNKNKNIIRKKILKILQNKKEFSYYQFLLYVLALNNEIILPKEEFEVKMINFVDCEIYQKEEEEKTGVRYGKIYDIEDLIRSIFILLANDLIVNLNSISKYGDKNEYIKFIAKGMDEKIFNAKWISKFTKKLNVKLSTNEKIKNKIEEYIKLNLEDIDTINTYLKYYF